MYRILEKEFKNKEEITNWCKDIVSRNINKELKDEDLNFMIEIFKNHPHWSIKSKNMKSIFVDIDNKYQKNYCFFIKKNNETCDDISYHISIKHIKVISNINIDLIIPFGKYKGISIYDIEDTKYLEWLVSIPNLSRDLKVKIGQFLRYDYIPYNPVSSNEYKKRVKAIQK